MIAVYCVVETLSGAQFEVKSINWIRGIQSKSPGAKASDSPWKNYFEEMAKKTIFKQVSKWIPKDAVLATAIEIDNSVERPDIAKPAVIDIDMPEAEDAEPKALAAPEPREGIPVGSIKEKEAVNVNV